MLGALKDRTIELMAELEKIKIELEEAKDPKAKKKRL